LKNTPVLLGILRNHPANGFTLRFFGHRANGKAPIFELSNGILPIRPNELWHVDEHWKADD
jgi:hypothetical protein